LPYFNPHSFRKTLAQFGELWTSRDAPPSRANA
jgi:hypothetical protein